MHFMHRPLSLIRLLPYDSAVKWTCSPISSWEGARLQSLNPDSERGQPQQQQQAARRRPRVVTEAAGGEEDGLSRDAAHAARRRGPWVPVQEAVLPESLGAIFLTIFTFNVCHLRFNMCGC